MNPLETASTAPFPSTFADALRAAPTLVRLGIPLLAVAVAAAFLVGVRRTRAAALPRAALGVAAIFAIPGALALAGVLADAPIRPPPFLPVVLGSVTLAVLAARSSIGAAFAERLPFWVLVGAQGFRLPLELVMHRAAESGVMTVEMSYSGYNFDIVTGATAVLLALGLARGHVPRGVVLAWNVMGSALLAVVVGVAIAQLPWVAAFGAERLNRFVLHFPYVWLATVLVPFALFGHLVTFRRLAAEARSSLAGASLRIARLSSVPKSSR